MRTRTLVAGLAAAAALTLTACSSGDDANDSGGPPPATPAGAATAPARGNGAPTQAELEAAVRAYSDAYLSGQGSQAYAMLSERCRDRIDKKTFTAMTEKAKKQYGQQPIKSLAVDRMDGSMAWVTYTYDDRALYQSSEAWVFEDGQWRQDDC